LIGEYLWLRLGRQGFGDHYHVERGHVFSGNGERGSHAENASITLGGKECLVIQVKRVYEKQTKTDGRRFLVDRLWPRGMSKETLRVDGWIKDIAPSDSLRRWFGHDPKKWKEFRSRYFAELNSKQEAWQPILKAARRSNVTLLYSAHDTEHNNAVALRDYLMGKLEKG
jgi:uncharacterized protein YeaO (DUF488 family)